MHTEKTEKPRETEPAKHDGATGTSTVSCATCGGERTILVGRPANVLAPNTVSGKLWRREELRASAIQKKPFGTISDKHVAPCPECRPQRCYDCECQTVLGGAIKTGEHTAVRRLGVKLPTLTICICDCHDPQLAILA